MFQGQAKALPIQGTIYLPTCAARLNQAGTSQLTQMPRHERLTDAEYSRQIGHGHLLVTCQMIDNGQASEVAQGLQGRLEFAPIVHSVAPTPAGCINKSFINLYLYTTL